MVQMKHIGPFELSVSASLYIPHGSDETSLPISGSPAAQLYIPHGSDETLEAQQKVDYKYDFISHMVQMKLLPSCRQELAILPLYPTWFR